MRLSLSGLVAACLVLAVAGAVAKVIALLIVLAVMIAVLTKPRQTLAVITTLGVLNLCALYPFIMALTVGGLTFCRLAIKMKQPKSDESAGQNRLPHLP